MGNILRFFGGVLLTAFIVIVTLARLAVEIVGASTTPDDFALLKQRMPAMLNWLFSTPWWVPTILLFGASAAAAWLIWTGTKRAAAHEMQEHDAIDEQAIAAMIESRLAQIPSPAPRADLATHTDLHAQDEKLSSLSGRIDFVRQMVEGSHESVDARIKAIEEKQERLVSFAEQTVRNTRERFQNVDGGFKAIRHREQLAYHAEMIEEMARSLLRIREGKPVENWGEWSSQSSRWMTGVSLWIEIAEIYRDGCKQRIMVVAPEELHGDWPDDDSLFPNIDAIMAYRKVAVILGHFRLEQKPVDEAVVLAAFHSPSMKGREYPTGGDQ